MFRKSFIAGAVALAGLFGGVAHADIVNVAGVLMPVHPGESTNATGDADVKIGVDANGDLDLGDLTIVGNVLGFTATGDATFPSNQNLQLSYEILFTNLNPIFDLGGNLTGATFGGVTVEYFLQSMNDVAYTDYNDDPFNNATDGLLWLQLAMRAGDVAMVDFNVGLLGLEIDLDSAIGLDVTGGFAANNFDTNAFVNLFDVINITYSVTQDDVQPFADAIVLTGDSSTLIKPIPEPATLALLGAGLLGAGAMRRRRK